MNLLPRPRFALPAFFLLAACGSGQHSGGGGAQPPPPPPPVGGARTPLVPQSHSLYARLEGAQAQNACQTDAQCVKGGCSSEVCAAEQVTSTCELPADGWPIQNAGCGCVSGQCLWFSTDGRVLTEATGVKCGNAMCAAGEECFEHVGIGGPAAGKVHTCGQRCDPAKPNGGCPTGKRCGNMPDGPASVCF